METNFDKVGKSIPDALLQRDEAWREASRALQMEGLLAFQRQPGRRDACPICDANASKIGGVEKVDYRQCTVCQHLFCEILPTESFLTDYYARASSAQVEAYVNLSESTLSNRASEIGHPKVDYVHGVITGTGEPPPLDGLSWVDIGSGTGDVLVAATSLGYQAWGVEPDAKQAAVARGRGCSVSEEFLLDNHPPPKRIADTDVLSMFNLLEHVPDPVSFLRSVLAGKSKSSWIVIEVPRHPSLSSLVQLSGIHRVHRHINPPEHLHLFSDRSIEILLAGVGFEVVASWRFGSDALETFVAIGSTLGWQGNFRDEVLRMKIDRLQQRVDDFGLSDNMLVVGRLNQTRDN
jgi:SAM-dependent methyltransferase